MIQRNKILILGASSYVGQHLCAGFGPERTTATYNSRTLSQGVYFDATRMSLSDVIKVPEEYSHAIILFGINKPDLAAADIGKSDAFNISIIQSIIDQLGRWEIIPVFTSTESVFDGLKGSYTELDLPNPILTYGKQKVQIERYIKDHHENYLILRLARVLGSQPGDRTLFDEWHTAIQNQETIFCAHDQVSSPIYIDDVVTAIIRLIGNNSSGLFHLANIKPFNRLEILEMLVGELSSRFPVYPDIVPCSINDISLRERRPLDISMRPDKVVNAVGLSITEIGQVCRNFVENLSK